MVVVEGSGLPIDLHVYSAQPHELRLSEATLQTIAVPCRRGRPKTCPKELVADRTYDSVDFCHRLRRREIEPTIPTCERRKRKKPKRGRPRRTDAGYCQRWKVERCLELLSLGDTL